MIQPPADHALKTLWGRFVDEGIRAKIVRENRFWIKTQLRDSGQRVAPGSLSALTPLLEREVLSPANVSTALTNALRLQASTFDPLSTAVSTADDTGASTEVHVTTAIGDQVVPQSPQQSSSQLVLSHWALDTAFNGVLKYPAARSGRVVPRSMEDISALAADKHEKALLGNIILPQDIGVTYDMVGGLGEVKDLLRQSITYPLKYPRLYSEGVANEAVKGVLLFGPPGTGKTMLAKAVATEGGATFLSIDAGTIENKWLGESEKNAKAVFTLARRLAPCVIYMDEVSGGALEDCHHHFDILNNSF